MKPEYKTKIQSFLDGIENRQKIIDGMLTGKFPPDTEKAKTLSKEIFHLLQQIENLLDIS